MYTDNLINKIESYLPNQEVSKIIGAFEFAKDAHEGQKRKSGHDFIVHPVEVATHLARLELDPTVIISGLLHNFAYMCTYTYTWSLTLPLSFIVIHLLVWRW